MKELTSLHRSRTATVDEFHRIVSSDIPQGEIHLTGVQKHAGSRFVRFNVVNKNGTKPVTTIIPREGMCLSPMRVGDLFLSDDDICVWTGKFVFIVFPPGEGQTVRVRLGPGTGWDGVVMVVGERIG